jgi:Aldehyde oxidase and xanthine dehydrogenase, a/b hammerhead domain
MTDLLGSVIAAHGGLDRWRTVRAIDVTFNFYGGLLDLKGFPGHRRPSGGTIPSGRIATLDTQAAEAAPGVGLVMTYRNAPHMNRPAPFGSTSTAAAAIDLPLMQDHRLHWNGQPIAVVIDHSANAAPQSSPNVLSGTSWPIAVNLQLWF